jgi:hypothetical protein
MLRNAATVRLILSLAVLGAAAVGGTPLASASDSVASTPAASSPTTIVTKVSPVDSTGNLLTTYRISHRYSIGNCESGSSYTGAAYRCAAPQTPQGVLDPCWVTSNAAYVLCLTEPWSHKATRLHVTGGYDNSAALTPVHFAWGVELPHQVHCLRNSAGVAVVAGQPITFYCTKRTVIVGALQRGSVTWRARTYRRTKTSPHHYVSPSRQPVSTAWFGLASHPS